MHLNLQDFDHGLALVANDAFNGTVEAISESFLPVPMAAILSVSRQQAFHDGVDNFTRLHRCSAHKQPGSQLDPVQLR